jgi:hypothetical protein
MTLLKAGRMPLLAGLLCFLLLGFAGASYGTVRFDVVPSPTEVINTGRSEVTGSVNLIVRGPGNVTGTATGGDTQIGLIYASPAMQIDNDVDSGIRLIAGNGFPTASIVLVENFDLNGRCAGRITINIGGGNPVAENAFLRVEGVRGRIDASNGITPGTDFFVDLQSINDPSANLFTPDVVRVAKSLDGMNVVIAPDSLLLCFPTTGVPPAGTAAADYSITITEGFARAFVDDDAETNERVDSDGDPLGAPDNSTEFLVFMEAIPASVSGIEWQDSVKANNTDATLELVGTPSFDATGGTATAIYGFEAVDQTNDSDIKVETFVLQPVVRLKSGATQTGVILAGVTLAPAVAEASGCGAPNGDRAAPRFLDMIESDAVATNNLPADPTKEYASIIRCNCYLLFTYVTSTSTWSTGIAIANTTGDTAVFGTANEAPNQLGKVTFYYFDRTAGYVGFSESPADITSGTSLVDVVGGTSIPLPTGVTSFEGYIIARADFQFCHGFAFIADTGFASIAHGYIANVIPDPAIKGGRRAAAAAADATNIPAGESLNN